MSLKAVVSKILHKNEIFQKAKQFFGILANLQNKQRLYVPHNSQKITFESEKGTKNFGNGDSYIQNILRFLKNVLKALKAFCQHKYEALSEGQNPP